MGNTRADVILLIETSQKECSHTWSSLAIWHTCWPWMRIEPRRCSLLWELREARQELPRLWQLKPFGGGNQTAGFIAMNSAGAGSSLFLLEMLVMLLFPVLQAPRSTWYCGHSWPRPAGRAPLPLAPPSAPAATTSCHSSELPGPGSSTSCRADASAPLLPAVLIAAPTRPPGSGNIRAQPWAPETVPTVATATHRDA